MTETKRARFVRVAEYRTQSVIDALHTLSKTSHSACYEFTEQDIEKIFAAIEQAMKESKDTMLGKNKFTLRKEP